MRSDVAPCRLEWEPLRPRLLNLLTALSLLLSVAAVALWVRSNWVSDHLEYRTGRASYRQYREIQFDSSRGTVAVTRRTMNFERAEACEAFLRDTALGLSHATGHPSSLWTWTGWPSVWNDLGFRRLSDRHTTTLVRVRRDPVEVDRLGPVTKDETTMQFPHWFPWLLFLAGGWPLVARFSRLAMARWSCRPGLCPRCGYDRRATPGRCPECGAGVAKSC